MEQTVYDRIKNLYEQDHRLIDRYNTYCYGTSKLNTDLENIRNISLSNYNLKTLEQFDQSRHENTKGKAYSLAKLWAFLPPKTTLDEFGEEAVFWTWNKFNDGERNNFVLKQYALLTGKDGELVKNARIGIWRMSYNNNCEDIWIMYKFFAELDKKLSEIDLKNILLKNTPNAASKEKVSKIIDKYSLQKLLVRELNDKGRGYDRYHDLIYPEDLKFDKNQLSIIYMDTPVGIALAYDNKPIALTTFVSKNGIFEIHQIQGIRDLVVDKNEENIIKLRTKGLFDFNWKKVLVEIAEETAKSFYIEKCIIISANNNRWTKTHYKNGGVHLELEDAIETYDKTAKSMGYKKPRGHHWNWYKILS